jgi:phosphoglycerate dehydrogenase-like enzyme
MPRPTVALILNADMHAQLMTPPVVQALEAFAVSVRQPTDGNLPPEQLADAVAGCDGALTTWGSPQFTAATLERAPGLRMIAHAAGSIRPIVAPEVFERGVVVSSAAPIIAYYVAEHCLGLAIMLLRNTARHDRAMRAERTWGSPAHKPADSLFDVRVGLVGFGHVSRWFARLLRPFGGEVWACDPYVGAATAAELGVKLVPLDQLLRACRVVSLHAANLPQNRHLIGARELALLPDGACLINTARGALLDHAALIAELKRGRIQAALDVTEPEPLPAESELRDLPNTVLTPHVAGPTSAGRWHMAQAMVEELRRFFAGAPLRYQVARERLASMA